MMEPLDAWFVREILPYERALMRFIRRNWRDEAEFADLRQGIYTQLFDGARQGIPSNARAYLFASARNYLIDRVRRAKVIPIDAMADLENIELATDLPGPDRHLQGRQELARLQRALDALPPACRQVVTLRKIDGLSQREVAQRLEISEGTVEKQVGKAMRLLSEAVFGRRVYARRRKDRTAIESIEQ